MLPQWDDFKWTLRRAWLVVKHRPFFRCPFCKGKGGAMSGYYEPEWDECHACYRSWEQLEDEGMEWPVGRTSLCAMLNGRLALALGFWEQTRLRDIVRCKLGIHRWMNEDAMEQGLRICRVCYESKSVASPSGGPSNGTAAVDVKESE